MSIKHYFASANSGVGFTNLFQNINNNGFTYVIKGGSGTGKSTLMKKVGEYFSQKGFCVEFFHCSADAQSLDGVRICEKNIAIVDGTAPHICDVSYPGVDGKILDVGTFVDSKIKVYENDIKEIVSRKQMHYKDFYGYLNVIYDLQKINQNNHKNFENNVFFEENEKILKNFNIKSQNKIGKIRELFFDSLQENGFVNFVNENNYKKVVEIQKDIFCLNQQLNLLKESFVQNGYDVIVLKNCVMPELISAVAVPEIDAIVVGKDVGLDSEVFVNNKPMIEKLLCLAQNSIRLAKSEHKKLEEIYILNMNFKPLEKLTKNVIEEIVKK